MIFYMYHFLFKRINVRTHDIIGVIVVVVAVVVNFCRIFDRIIRLTDADVNYTLTFRTSKFWVVNCELYMQYAICREWDAFMELHTMKMEQMIHHNEIFMLECCKNYVFLLYASPFFIRFRIPGLNFMHVYPLWCVKLWKLYKISLVKTHKIEWEEKKLKSLLECWTNNIVYRCSELCFILFSWHFKCDHMLFSCRYNSCWDYLNFSNRFYFCVRGKLVTNMKTWKHQRKI